MATLAGRLHFDVASAVRTIEQRLAVGRPTLVAIDGRSGVGKSTFASALARVMGATVIDGDDFFAGGVGVRAASPRERVESCIDWRRQRAVIDDLRQNRRAAWHRFDWTAFNGDLESQETTCDPLPIVVLEGVYSGRPELADRMDVRILLRAPPELRLAQLLSREGGDGGAIGAWEKQWHEAEDDYFATIATPACFDLVLDAR